MARILEALTHTDAKPPASAAASESVECPADDAVRDKVPFIEVGGGKLEASADVLNAAAPRAPTRAETAEPEGVRLVLHQPELESQAIRFRPLHAMQQDVRQRLAPELIAYHQPEHPISEQYRALLPSLLEADAPPQALLLSGVADGTGTTTVLLNVAITAARQERQVVVVDAGLCRPALAARLGIPAAPGLFEVLTGLIALPRALRETGIFNLYALTAGEVGVRPCWAVRSVGATLHQLRKRFDLVLVDAPAWTGGAEMVALGNACDAVYLVLPHDRADAPETDALVRSLPRLGVNLRGCIVAQR